MDNYSLQEHSLRQESAVAFSLDYFYGNTTHKTAERVTLTSLKLILYSMSRDNQIVNFRS